jgi:hypothetical protein
MRDLKLLVIFLALAGFVGMAGFEPAHAYTIDITYESVSNIAGTYVSEGYGSPPLSPPPYNFNYDNPAWSSSEITPPGHYADAYSDLYGGATNDTISGISTLTLDHYGSSYASFAPYTGTSPDYWASAGFTMEGLGAYQFTITSSGATGSVDAYIWAGEYGFDPYNGIQLSLKGSDGTNYFSWTDRPEQAATVSLTLGETYYLDASFTANGSALYVPSEDGYQGADYWWDYGAQFSLSVEEAGSGTGPGPGPDPNQVPEPASLFLVGLGIAGLAIVRRRKR